MDNTDLWLAMRETKYKRTMSNISSILSDENADPIAMVEAAFSEIVAAVHAETGTLWVHQKYGDGLVHPVAVYKGSLSKDFTIKVGEGIAGKSIQDSKGFIIADCQQDPRWAGKADAKSGFVTKSMLCVPLATEAGCFGCIQIINKSDGLLFDNKDFEFASKLTADVAVLFEARHITDKLLVGKKILNKVTYGDAVNAPTDEEALTILDQVESYEKLPKRKQRKAQKLVLGLRNFIRQNS